MRNLKHKRQISMQASQLKALKSQKLPIVYHIQQDVYDVDKRLYESKNAARSP